LTMYRVQLDAAKERLGLNLWRGLAQSI